MPIHYRMNESSKTCEIRPVGRFDFGLHTDFRRAFESGPQAAEFTVDLSQTEYMDSSALGMLLVLLDYAKERRAKVRLKAPTPAVRRILAIARFEKLFPID